MNNAMRLLVVTILLHVTAVSTHRQKSDCNYGNGCPFLCHCATVDVCDPLTGCPGDCLVNKPDYPSSKPGWEGDGCQTGNVAFNKTAWQYGVKDDRVASLAVDGVVERGDGGVAQPLGTGGRAWWTVDLGALHTVFSTMIMNTNLDTGSLYLTNIRVYVSNTSILNNNTVLNTTDDIMRYGDFVTCGEHPAPVPKGGDADVQCGAPLIGRYVLVYKYDDDGGSDVRNSFVVAEVTVRGHRYVDCFNCTSECNSVYGCMANCEPGKNQTTFCSADCKDGSFGVNCGESCSGNCVNDTMCETINGTCPGGCKLWWADSLCATAIAPPVGDIVHTLMAPNVTFGNVTLTWDPLKNIPSGLESHYGYVIGQQNHQDQRLETIAGDLWTDIAWINHTATVDTESYTVKGLNHNSWFSFRLQVYRQDQGVVEKAPGNGTIDVKTSCIAPEEDPILSVEILELSYGLDIYEAANVTWDLMAPAVSGCDFIREYIFSYQPTGGNITEHRFDNTTNSFMLSENETNTYVIVVTARNNEDLDAFNETTVDLQIFVDHEGDDSNNAGMIAGVTIAVLVVIALVIVLLVLWMKRRNGKDGGQEEDNKSSTSGSAAINISGYINTVATHDVPLADDDTDCIYQNFRPGMGVIPLPMLRERYNQLKAQHDGFKALYNSLPTGDKIPGTFGQQEEHKIKNRFLNITAYDHSRVSLATADGEGYINASYIKGYNARRDKHYVATQGPIPTTQLDFWEMIWQIKSCVIVMLTPLIENSKRKCHCYWPESVDESVTHGVITITLREMVTYADYTHRTFTVKTSQGTERVVQHLQYLAWPDKERPRCTFSLLAFLWRVRSVHTTGAPLVVHCSAGVGRTGTFIALDLLVKEAEVKDAVDIMQCVRNLRGQRTKMVQTQAQFEFLYEALIDYAKVGRTTLQGQGFRESYAKLTQKTRHGDTALSAQHATFQRLLSDRPVATYAAGGLEDNIKKNRFRNILPDDRCRPYLSTPYEGGNDYINAVFVKGFRKEDGFIVTQAALRNTTVDFWRLVNDFHVSTIVMLNDSGASDTDPPTYWPTNGKMTMGPLDVILHDESTTNNWIVRELTVKRNNMRRATDGIRVRQYQLKGWGEGRPTSQVVKALLELHENAMAHGELYPTQPVLVHCLDGASRCGVFCALDHVIGATKSYGEVDIMLAARSVASNRREFIQDVDQYTLLHDLALEYVGQFDTYDNFR